MLKIVDRNVSELLELMDKKEITSEDIVRAYISEIDKLEDKDNMFVYIDKTGAIEKAKKIDEKRSKGENLGKLSGLPILLTDEISEKNKLTRAGSKMLEDYKPPFDASLVERLKREDAVILAKIKISEFGLKRTDYLAEAIMNKAGLLGLSSDFASNMRKSASENGLFSMKASYGSISRYGIIGATSSLDQIGLVTNNLKDMAIALNSIISYDQKDSTSVKIEKVDYEKEMDKKFENIKIAVIEEYLDDSSNLKVKENMLKVMDIFQEMDIEVERISIPILSYVDFIYEILASAELSSNSAKYDGIRYGYRAKEFESIEELYKKSRTESFEDSTKQQIIFGNYVLSSEQYEDYYEKSQKIRTLVIDELEKTLENYDFIISPISSISLADGIRECGLIANISGLPSIFMPENKEDNKIAFQILGSRFKEEDLLKIANKYENYVNEKITKGGEKE